MQKKYIKAQSRSTPYALAWRPFLAARVLVQTAAWGVKQTNGIPYLRLVQKQELWFFSRYCQNEKKYIPVMPYCSVRSLTRMVHLEFVLLWYVQLHLGKAIWQTIRRLIETEPGSFRRGLRRHRTLNSWPNTVSRCYIPKYLTSFIECDGAIFIIEKLLGPLLAGIRHWLFIVVCITTKMYTEDLQQRRGEIFWLVSWALSSRPSDGLTFLCTERSRPASKALFFGFHRFSTSLVFSRILLSTLSWSLIVSFDLNNLK